MASLYVRLGEKAAISALAEILYDRIYAEDSLKVFFEGVDRTAMEKKQVEFLSDIFGGPKIAADIDMRAVHRPLVEEKGLNEGLFDYIAGLVKEILQDMSVAPKDIAEALVAIAAFKDDILNQ